MEIKPDNNIFILDEAHNIEGGCCKPTPIEIQLDAARSSGSVEIGQNTLVDLRKQLERAIQNDKHMSLKLDLQKLDHVCRSFILMLF